MPVLRLMGHLRAGLLRDLWKIALKIYSIKMPFLRWINVAVSELAGIKSNFKVFKILVLGSINRPVSVKLSK